MDRENHTEYVDSNGDVYNVIKSGEYFGFSENDVEVVPTVHDSKENAIEEWVYFEKLNTTERIFLNHVRTIAEIDDIAYALNNS